MSFATDLKLLEKARFAHRAGELDQAVTLYQKLFVLSPALPEAIHVLGGLCIDRELNVRGLDWLARSLQLESLNPTFLLNFAVGLQRFSKFDDALTHLLKALSIQPMNADIHLNLGHVYKELTRVNEAKKHYHKCIAINPSGYAAYDHLSLICDAERNLSACVSNIDRAVVSSGSQDIDLLYRQGLYYLLLGRFASGWDLLEYRWHAPQIVRDGKYTKPLQTSKPVFRLGVKPGILFLWAEQGIGDEIMFNALIKHVLPHVQGVILQVDGRLIGLARRAYTGVIFVKRPAVPAESQYDYHLPIGSLARLFRRDKRDFLREGLPYLSPDLNRFQECRRQLGTRGIFRIGISWYSRNGDHRCVELERLALQLYRPNVQLVSLQYGDFSQEIADLNINSGFDLVVDTGIDCENDVEGLAALICSCDLVISIANATSHLAGALGVKTWTLLPRFPGWRWLNEGRDSLWYRSMRIYRQPESGLWDDVLSDLSRDLSGLL
jgi:hypothetical protein